MGLLALFGKKKQADVSHSDVLGAYPERMQISAIPERRYLRTSRILAVTTFLNLGILIAMAGVFVYLAARLDVSVANRRVVNLYTMDTEHKIIQASEYDRMAVPALQLMVESALQDYVINRHTVVWDQESQEARWGAKGVVARYSSPKMKKTLEAEKMSAYNDSRSKKVVKDVHLYTMNQRPSGIWEGLVDIFDMPIPDMFNPLCDCSENTRACLACKAEHSLSRTRYKVFIRARYSGAKTPTNPLGIMIENYSLVPQYIDDKEKNWNLPPILRPEL